MVNAAGAWARQVGLLADLDLPITTWKHDTAFLRRPKDLGPEPPDGHRFHQLDVLPPRDRRPDAGRAGGRQSAAACRRTSAISRSPTSLSGLSNGFAGASRGWTEGRCTAPTAGYDGLTPDQRAILGPAGPQGLFLDCGFSGTGFKIAPAVGACMAEWIVDGRPKTVDVSGFTLDRFAEGRR